MLAAQRFLMVAAALCRGLAEEAAISRGGKPVPPSNPALQTKADAARAQDGVIATPAAQDTPSIEELLGGPSSAAARRAQEFINRRGVPPGDSPHATAGDQTGQPRFEKVDPWQLELQAAKGRHEERINQVKLQQAALPRA